MNYYPPELTDWWMDDWISFVYGYSRTFKAISHPVLHHTGAHGQRYDVDRSNENLLESLITKGHNRILSYMLKNDLSADKIQKYQKSDYLPGQSHQDIPKHIR